MMTRRSGNGSARRLRELATLSIGLATALGCGAKAKVTLYQPGLPSPQDVVQLESDWAYVANDQPGLERIVLMFPFPGARAGDRQFFLYLRVAEAGSKPCRIGDPLPAGGRVRGFFIQATGRLAGKAMFSEGRIELHHGLLSRGSRRGKIDLKCEDGSSVKGRFEATVAPLDVNDFEDLKAGDIRALIKLDAAGDPKRPGTAPAGEKVRP